MVQKCWEPRGTSGLLSLWGKNWGTISCDHYCSEGKTILLEAKLVLERLNSGPLDHACLQTICYFFVLFDLCNWL